jgi:hypothetical protein
MINKLIINNQALCKFSSIQKKNKKNIIRM